MNKVPIFDSLTHPMPDSSWLKEKYAGKNNIAMLLESMKRNNVVRALAVGLGSGCGGYVEESYADYIRSNSDNLTPVAYFDFSRISKTEDIYLYISHLKFLGYEAIKIHPRIANITYKTPFLSEVINVANNLDLGVLLCTYFWGQNCGYGETGLEGLANLLYQHPNQQMILLHGGAVSLLEVSEMVRHFPNVLLDLSFTLCKYEGSSIDMDIRFLFKNFDKRICVGSDSPEFTQDQLRARFDYFSEGLPDSKIENIAYKNITEHLKLHAKY